MVIKYNGYKVYRHNGCQIMTEDASSILEKIILKETEFNIARELRRLRRGSLGKWKKLGGN